MSSQFPVSNPGPYQPPGQGGFQPPPPASHPLKIPAIILIVLSSLWLLYGIVNFIYSMMTGMPPNLGNQGNAAAQQLGFYAAIIMLPIINLGVLLGSIMMLKRKAYPLAMAGAFLALVPICGPCFVLGIPFGIWCLVLLFQADVKNSFS
ncbi:hypothetical protein [Novipirellula sp.]|uniref:hypothetical protein n=1 Tax=Novipirellula sp. TaxID=2795430 RepID=UPI0035693948